MLRGNLPAKIDEKGRIKIPADFRKFIDEKYGPDLYVTSLTANNVLIYPLSEWEEIEAKLMAPPKMKPEKVKFLRNTNYYGQLIQMDKPSSKGRDAELEQRAERELAAIGTEESIVQELDKHMDSSDESQAFRRAAVVRLASPEVQSKTEHALLPFSSLLEPNPRAMKRFVNTYGVQRAVAILVGAQIGVAELALWTIVSLRWPLLAQYLEDSPELLEKIGDPNPDGVRADLRPLFGNQDVCRVIKWKSTGSDRDVLSAEKLRTIIGLAPSESSTPGIA